MFNFNEAIPVSPNVASFEVFTFKGFLIMFTLSEMFLNICCDMYEHAAPVSNRAVIVSVLGILTAKFDNFNFAYSKLDIILFCSKNLPSNHSVPSVSLDSLSSDVIMILGSFFSTHRIIFIII